MISCSKEFTHRTSQFSTKKNPCILFVPVLDSLAYKFHTISAYIVGLINQGRLLPTAGVFHIMQ